MARKPPEVSSFRSFPARFHFQLQTKKIQCRKCTPFVFIFIHKMATIRKLKIALCHFAGSDMRNQQWKQAKTVFCNCKIPTGVFQSLTSSLQTVWHFWALLGHLASCMYIELVYICHFDSGCNFLIHAFSQAKLLTDQCAVMLKCLSRI